MIPGKPDFLFWSYQWLEIVDVIRGIEHHALKRKIDNILCDEQDCGNCIL